jgi:hypothetical protein
MPNLSEGSTCEAVSLGVAKRSDRVMMGNYPGRAVQRPPGNFKTGIGVRQPLGTTHARRRHVVLVGLSPSDIRDVTACFQPLCAASRGRAGINLRMAWGQWRQSLTQAGGRLPAVSEGGRTDRLAEGRRYSLPAVARLQNCRRILGRIRIPPFVGIGWSEMPVWDVHPAPSRLERFRDDRVASCSWCNRPRRRT